jgi:iron(III) transport system ATP-binding protein
VALARAIVAEPRVLLFDEPLSNLDSELRESLCREMASLLRQLGITAVYVTHDRREAEILADRIVHLSAGRVDAIRSITTTSGEIA